MSVMLRRLVCSQRLGQLWRHGTMPALCSRASRPDRPLRQEPGIFAEAELNEVAAYFDQASCLVGGEATKTALLDAARRATHIHFACHGRFDPADPLGSYLELAGEGAPDRLRLRELLVLRPFPTARLVVASSCQTAITDFMHVPDESIGLPGVILKAGVPGAVGTLWAVNDLSTALVITRFYECHLGGEPAAGEGGQSPAHALRAAQRWLRDLSGQQLVAYAEQHPQIFRAAAEVLSYASAYPSMRPYASPYHWAGFM